MFFEHPTDPKAELITKYGLIGSTLLTWWQHILIAFNTK